MAAALTAGEGTATIVAISGTAMRQTAATLRVRRVVTLLVVGTFGCTSTQIGGSLLGAEEARDLRLGAVEVRYAGSVPPERITLGTRLDLSETLDGRIESWLQETGRWGGPDALAVEIDQFRLPGIGTRWISGSMKGNDYLGAGVTVTRAGNPVAKFHVEHTIGAGDRSIAENYSADRALENLVDAVAWAIVHAVTPFEQRKPIFEIGKREQVEQAIELLELCGELSYAEATKYGVLGKLSVATGAGAEYRRVKRVFGARPPRCY